MRALRSLRGIEGGRNPAVVASMIQLAQTSTDPELRADIWRQMSGAKDRQLIPALLQAVRFDKNAEAREEAAETLEDFVIDPGVKSTLEQIAQNDPDEDVRRQAQNALGRGRRRR